MLPRFAFVERTRLQLVSGCEELLYSALGFIQSFRSGPRQADRLQTVVAQLEEGDLPLEQSLAMFEEGVRLDPSYLKGWLNLGVTYTEMDDPQKALVALGRARVLAPGNPAVWYNMAVALESLKRYEEALAAYTKTALLDPGEAAAKYRKGKLLSRMERYEESLAALSETP